MTIVITIPINAGNSVIAENMIDWIYQLNGRKQVGHALICYDADVHAERRERVKIACELAFLSFDEIIMPSRSTKERMASANAARNNLFLGVAEHCQKTFRLPWLWLEPGSCPTNPKWFDNICALYEAQPRRYMGTHLKVSAEAPDKFLHPVSIYHMGCFNDVGRAVNENIDAPFEVVAGPIISMRSSKWRSVQPLKILDESDFSKIWEEAQIVFGDDAGALIEKYRADGVHHVPPTLPSNGNDGYIHLDSPPPSGNGQSSTSTVLTEQRLSNGRIKLDLRTREGRAMKAALAKEQHAQA